MVPLVRREAQAAELRGPGVEPRMLDIETSGEEAFAAAFDGVDAVVFAAGGGPDGNIERKRTVDLQGALKSVAGSRAAGVRRYVQVSAIGVDDPLPPDVGEVWAAYVAAKRDSDAAVRASDLDWTIIRPGGLTDEPGTGRVALAPELPAGRCRGPTSPPSSPRCSPRAGRSASSGPSWAGTCRWRAPWRRPPEPEAGREGRDRRFGPACALGYSGRRCPGDPRAASPP